MYTCYDCEKFGMTCKGMINDPEVTDDIRNICNRFIVVRWRKEMFKDSSSTRI